MVVVPQTGIGSKWGKTNLKSKVVFCFRLTEFEVPVTHQGSNMQSGEESADIARALARKMWVGKIAFWKICSGWGPRQKWVCSGINVMKMWWQGV